MLLRRYVDEAYMWFVDKASVDDEERDLVDVPERFASEYLDAQAKYEEVRSSLLDWLQKEGKLEE